MIRKAFVGGILTLAAVSTVAATDFHVNKGVACSDSNPGTSTQPLCSVQAGLNKLSAAGDAAIIHTGVYNECASLARNVRGTATSPIRIKGADGESPAGIVIDASTLSAAQCPAAPTSCDSATRRGALTLKGTWGSPIGYVEVSNLTVRPPGLDGTVTKNNGVDLQCVDHLELRGVRSDSQPSFPTAAGAETGDAIINMYNAQFVLVDKADISNGGASHPGFHAVLLQDGSTSDIAIVNSKVRDLDGGFVCQSGGVNRVEILFNDVSNMESGCDGENLVQTYNVDFIRLGYNRFAGNAGFIIRPRGYNSQSAHTRLSVKNNLFRARGGGQTAVQFGYAADSEAMWLGIFRNNIFSGYSVGFSYLAARVRDCDITEDNNAFYPVTTAVVDGSTCGFLMGSHSLMLVTNPLGSNDCPVVSASVINGGYSKSSTPKRGSGLADIGACENGETAGAWTNPYDFKPLDSTSSATPKLTWDGVSDANVNLVDLDFKRFLKGAAQTDYECQVDSLYTFNSQGIGKPRWSSGVVTSTATNCTVGTSLPNGEYFARVRINGQIWSDLFKFTVGGGAPGPVCGNGVLESGESCDGADLGAATCITQGFTGGTLSCTAACAYNTSACTTGSGGGTTAAAIQFIDVASAPVGAYVTIRGRGFGSAQGTSQVFFGGVVATSVPVWSDTRIVAQVPSGAGSPVKVRIASVDTNTVTFATHTGRVLWVAKTGSDTNACTSSSAPCLTINRAAAVAVAGDVVMVRSGSYCESSGGAGLYVRSGNSGTSSQPITYRSYPAEAVTVDCCGTCGGSSVYLEGNNIQVSGLRATGARGTGFVIIGDGNRVADCESSGNNLAGYASTSGSGVNVQLGSNNAKVLGCSIHDNGSVSNLDHGMYLKGDNMEIAFNTIFNNTLGYGIQLYEGSGTTFTAAKVHSNLIYANGNAGITVNNGAVNAELFNNEIRGNSKNGVFIGSSGSSLPTGAKIYNNTIYDNDAGNAGYPQIRIQNGTGHVLKNNVVTGSNALMVRKDAAATGVILDDNQYGSNASTSFQWEGINGAFTGWKSTSGQDATSGVGDPLFVNVGILDLHLASGSPARDIADVAMAPPFDRDRTARPQGSGPDRGAYEGLGSVIPPGAAPSTVRNLKRNDRH